jgi:hypothetical protein
MRRAVTYLGSATFALSALSTTSCRDLSGFSTNGDSYGGEVVGASFVLSGMQTGTKLCLTVDTDHLQDAPGSFSTSDGMFSHVPFRPIPQMWHDTLSTLNFGEGRLKNMLYVVTPSTTPPGEDAFAVISLMQSGHIEVRLLRGAPAATPGGPGPGPTSNLFAIFDLTRNEGACSF